MLQGHHWSNAITMATPLSHKGATAGAKVVATTVIDFLTKPQPIVQAKDYFKNVQSKEVQYQPMITEKDPPPKYLNEGIMKEFRSELEKLYYDETKYDSYLEQLNIQYPTLK